MADVKYVVEEVNHALARNIGRPRTVLDVGCGIGLNGRIAKDRGAHVVGIDTSAGSVERARKVLDEAYVVDLEHGPPPAPLEGRKFDLVMLGDLVERSADPLSVMQRVADMLEDGGHILVSLPNLVSWTEGLELKDDQPRVPEAFEHVTSQTVVPLLQAAGLEVMRIDLRPMIVRSFRPLARRGISPVIGTRPEARALSRVALRHPIQSMMGLATEGLVFFQGVVVARKAPRPGKLSLTIGMLTLNEQDSVEKMIDEIRQYAPDAQILLIDSSSDRTPDLAIAKGATVVRQLPPRGHGPAMERLMYEAAAQSDALIYLDCDFTYPANMIPRIRELLEEGADVVNASRTHHYPKAMPVPNFLANRLFAAAAQVVHGVPTTDVHSGMRGYRSSVMRAFDFSGEGDALPVDTLVLPAKSNYHVIEFPIPYQERVGVSKLAKVRGTVWTFARIAMEIGEGERVRPGRRYRHVKE